MLDEYADQFKSKSLPLVTDGEIEDYIGDEIQQDWNDLAYKKVYEDGLRVGIKFIRDKLQSTEEPKVDPVLFGEWLREYCYLRSPQESTTDLLSIYKKL